jgi:hypothetical protein
MWELLKTAITGVKDALGIEIPELPIDAGSIDVGSIGEAATTAVQDESESATAAVDGMATAGEAITTDVAGVTETLAGSSAAVDSAAQVLPGATDVLSGRGR